MNNTLIQSFKQKPTKFYTIFYISLLILLSILFLIFIKESILILLMLSIPIILSLYFIINNFIFSMRKTLMLYSNKIIIKDQNNLLKNPLNINYIEIEEIEISNSNIFFFKNNKCILILNTKKLKEEDFNFIKNFFIKNSISYNYIVNDITK